MTLNSRNVTLAEKKFYRAHQKNLNEYRLILSAAKCRPMILVSRNVEYAECLEYSRGFLGEGASLLSNNNKCSCLRLLL